MAVLHTEGGREGGGVYRSVRESFSTGFEVRQNCVQEGRGGGGATDVLGVILRGGREVCVCASVRVRVRVRVCVCVCVHVIKSENYA